MGSVRGRTRAVRAPPRFNSGGDPRLGAHLFKAMVCSRFGACSGNDAVETDLTPPFSKLPCFELVDTILILKLEFGLVQF